MAISPPDDAAKTRPLAIRLGDASRRIRWGRTLTIVLTLTVIAAGVATYVILASPGALGSLIPRRVVGVVDVVLVLLLAALVAGRVIRVWIERRRGAAGSRMHVRLVVMFSLVAVTPAIVLAILGAPDPVLDRRAGRHLGQHRD